MNTPIFHNFFGHCAPLRMPIDRPEGNTMTVGQSCRLIALWGNWHDQAECLVEWKTSRFLQDSMSFQWQFVQLSAYHNERPQFRF